MAPASKVFVPYRALGLVSNKVPLVIRYIKRRKENLIVTVIGNSFHTYGSSKLTLLSVGNPHENTISCMSADAFHVYTASNNIIYAWRRGTELKHKYCGHKDEVHLLLPFGPHLISVDRMNILCVWDIKNQSLYSLLEFSKKSIEITTLLHPATYLNKVVIGSKQGKLHLWNLKTNAEIYVIDGWGTEVCALEQAPAIDVVAVGLIDGRILLHNLKFNETIVNFKQDWGRVSCISFRTDGSPTMITGSEIGHMAVWDLKERRLSSQMRNCHDGAITGLKCLPNEPLMVSSSADNSLKMWIFDLPDGGARLLKLRDGHAANPLTVRFHGSLGATVLTAGEDATMRMFSTVTDILNQSLGQASYNRKASKRCKGGHDKLKMPPITGFTSSQETAWDNLVAIHRGKSIVSTWSIKKQRMGDHKLEHTRFKEKDFSHAITTCLELSFCGNYVLIGYDTGHLDKYNIQSGLFRGSFGSSRAHEEAIRGVVTDGLNHYVVSGCQEGNLKWWRIKDCKEINTLTMDASIAKMILHRDSGLLAVALEDWSVQVVDMDTQSVVRKLHGHFNQITDIAFSPDSRWLISSSLDRTIRTWDLPSIKCIDCFLVPAPVSSMDMSPIGDFLVTTHTGHLGVYLWVNQSCYNQTSLQALPHDFKPSVASLPSTSADEGQLTLQEGEEEAAESETILTDDDEYKSPEQVSEELITLALLPTSRWMNLLNLNQILKRNKPVEPARVPKSAPFFLPSVPGLEFKFAPDKAKDKNESESKMNFSNKLEAYTKFGNHLKNTNYKEAITLLISMGPSAVDVEIGGLSPDIGGSMEIMINFINMIQYAFEKHIYFEAAQGYLGLFLKTHSEYIINNVDLSAVCQVLCVSQGLVWHTLRNNLDQSLCILSYLKNAALVNY